MIRSDRPDFFSITTVGERGQVVIPKSAREALNLGAGDRLAQTAPAQPGDCYFPAAGPFGQFGGEIKTVGHSHCKCLVHKPKKGSKIRAG